MKASADTGYIKSKLQWLMFFRLLFATFFLGIATITQLRRSDSYITVHLMYLYILTGSAFGLTFIYAWVLRFVKRIVLFAYLQITVDMLFISALLYITGGINSIFSFLYSISIISASICLFISGGLYAATLASALYSALILLQQQRLIFPLQLGGFTATGYENEHVYFPIIINVSAFYIVAVLSNILAEQAKKSREQLKKKQLDLEQLEALNEKIIQNIPSGLVTLNQNRQIVTFNHAAEEITGCSFSQVYLKPVADIFPETEPLVDSLLHCQAARYSAPDFEAAFSRMDGQTLWLGFSGSSIKNTENREIGCILVFQDLTAFKNMQEHLKRIDRLAAVGRLAAGLAHEVRNPLASISGSIQVLKKSLQLTNSDSHLMDIIVQESNNLSLLISDFTQYARAEEPSKEKLALKMVADEVVELFRNSSECGHVRQIDQLIPETIGITANRQQMKQVLWNLILNSAQAMILQRGGIRLAAAALPPGAEPTGLAIQADGWVEISITDEGCGIKASELGSIFDPFFTTKDNGIGLGLAIVHKIVQEHNGLITVKSQEDIGTEFKLYLPAAIL